MDDDFMDDQDYGLEYSDDSASEPDVDLENQYYNAKALKAEKEFDSALKTFRHVLELESAKGEWGFKALKQMVKITFAANRYDEMLNYYRQLLTYIKSAVTKNYSEKSINSILDYISTSKQMDLLQIFYETTLDALKDAKNERLWFKTNTKLGKLYFDQKEFEKLEKIIKQLRNSCKNELGEEDQKKGTQLLEIYALEIQMYTEQKNNKALKALYEQSLHVKSAIPHPLIMGVIRECGGKMHLREKQFEKAHTDFFEAFKNYDESGSERRIACLKYLVLANMLIKSGINPFDSQEAKPFRNDPEIVAMNQLVGAYQDNNLVEFESILEKNRDAIMADPFIREHIEELLTNIRSQVLISLCVPYSRIYLSFLAEELRVKVEEVLVLLADLILDGALNAKIDEINGILISESTNKATRCAAIAKCAKQLSSLHLSIVDRSVQAMASASTALHSSSAKLAQTVAAERRKKVFLGQLPVDFLRIAIPSPTSVQRQRQQSVVPFYIADPNLVAQQALLQAQHAFYSFVPPNTRGRISITVVEAKLVKNYGLVRMDPYCCVRVGNSVFETPRNFNGGKTPKWNRIINAYLPYGVESFYLQIYDEKAFTADECIAWAHIILPNGIFGGETIDDWYQLSGQQGEGKEGVINLITSFTPV